MDPISSNNSLRGNPALNLPTHNEGFGSGVSWAAVLGGAVVASALSLALLALGTGLGLSSVSPWSNMGASAATIGTAAVIWLILMQLIASGLGGYVAGRLRTKWVNVHTDEVYFRDTAHGFLVWAVGLIISAAFLTSAATSILGGAAKTAAAGVSAGVTTAATTSSNGPTDAANPQAYFVDSLFRSDTTPANTNNGASSTEIARIFAKGLTQSEFPAADKAYLVKQVSLRTGLSPADAEKRVSDTIGQSRAAENEALIAAEVARKKAAHAMLWVFLSLIIGAFVASYGATIGGRQRDHVYA